MVTTESTAPQPVSEAPAPKIVGIIHPPPDIKVIIDKTASFVAKNGPDFEVRIIAKEGQNPKFAFLIKENPYNAYYRKRITDIREGTKDESKPDQQMEQETSQASPTAEATESSEGQAFPKQTITLTAPKKILEPPKPDVYLIPNPRGILPLDLEVLKLTAQFTARNGRQFLSTISGRESRNPQFDFLRPNHPLFRVFTAYVDAYTAVIAPAKETIERLQKNIEERLSVLNMCSDAAEYYKQQASDKKKKEEEEEAERQAFNSIDWHDFVVVETIDFSEEDFKPSAAGEAPSMPPPFATAEVKESAMAASNVSVPPPAPVFTGEAREEEMELEDETPAPPVEEPKATTSRVTVSQNPDEEENFERLVRKDYQRAAPKPAAPASALEYVKDPITGKLIPLAQAEKYLHIELLNPKWKDQKQREIEKQRNTNMATDDEFVRTIGNFAKKRTDIFGQEEVELGKTVHEEAQGEKKEKVVWDGHAASIQRTTAAALASVNIQEQIAAIQAQQAAQNAIGPSQPAAPMHIPMGVPEGLLPKPPVPAATTTPVASLLGAPPPGLVPRPPMPMMPGMPGMPGFMMPPMGMPGMMFPGQPALGVRPPPPPTDESAAKKQKTDEGEEGGAHLIPENQFLITHLTPVTFTVQTPEVQEWNLNGQSLSITMAVRESVSQLKERIKDATGMPPNKMKLRLERAGILKDSSSLAFYNVDNGAVVQLQLKERGGRK